MPYLKLKPRYGYKIPRLELYGNDSSQFPDNDYYIGYLSVTRYNICILDTNNNIIGDYKKAINVVVFDNIAYMIKNMIIKFCNNYKFKLFPNIECNKALEIYMLNIKTYFKKIINEENIKSENIRILKFSDLYVDPANILSPKLNLFNTSNNKKYVIGISKTEDKFYIRIDATNYRSYIVSDTIDTKDVLYSIKPLIFGDGKFPQKIIKNYLDSICYNMICKFCDNENYNYPCKDFYYYKFIENSLIYLFNGVEIL